MTHLCVGRSGDWQAQLSLFLDRTHSAKCGILWNSPFLPYVNLKVGPRCDSFVCLGTPEVEAGWP